MRVHQEQERKYDVDPGFTVPELDDLPGVAAVSPPEETQLQATYFDTPDLRLLGARVTLRRRTGGSDAGWHLKLPGTNDGKSDTRTEFQHPLGRATRTVPAPLAELVRAHTRGTKLAPVATIATTRRTYPLLDADGDQLAVVCDDEVTARRLSPRGQTTDETSWREIEVELAAGGVDLLDGAAARLRLAGARPAGNGSKLARVLAGATANSVAEESAAAEGTKPRHGAAALRRSSAGAVVLDAVRHQVATLMHWDPRVRRDQPDAVHQMRVTCRRLRSILGGYRLVLEREVTDPIRDELRWLGGELSPARDTEVMHQRLRQLIDQQPDELVVGPVRERVDATLTARYQEAHDRVLGVLDDRRYLRLLDSLDALVADPPFTDDAAAKARPILRRSVLHAWQRVAKRAAQAEAAETPERRDLLLHDVRKGAKQARYVSELAWSTFGAPARRFTKAMKDVQEVLGDHQDMVVTRDELRALGAQAHEAGEDGFTFGLLYAVETCNGHGGDEAYAAAWRAATRPKLHRWLS